MKLEVKKPIFVVGVGRSGSSIFHKILCEHPYAAWLSALGDTHFDNLALNAFFMKVIDYPLVGKPLKNKYIPSECYNFWEHHCKGFRRPFRDLGPDDVTNKTKAKIQNVMAALLTSKRDRLLLKITGWPRIGFLKEIFEDAKFIHIVRDGRAVVNSMINVNWWWGWQGPQNWRWGELTEDQQRLWEKHNKSFLALAGIEWNILMAATERASSYVCDKNFLTIRYEDICTDPIGNFQHVVEFCELDWSREFEKAIGRHALKNTNYKWQKELTHQQHKMLNAVMDHYLNAYNYTY